MKIQANTNPSAFFDNSQPHQPSMKEGEIIEMDVKDGVASVPTPLPMIGYRPPDIPGVILEDRLPPSHISVSAKYEAALCLGRSTTGVISKGG